MTQETRIMTCPVFRTKDNKPTCCEDLGSRKLCQFLRTTNFGTKIRCGVVEDPESKTGMRQIHPDPETGFLKPLKECPLWKDES